MCSLHGYYKYSHLLTAAASWLVTFLFDSPSRDAWYVLMGVDYHGNRDGTEEQGILKENTVVYSVDN